MWGDRLLWMVVGAALMAGVPGTANAQDTPDEYAESWTEARRGDRNWMQRATEQLTMGPIDRLFGPAADGTMKEITNRVIARVEQMYERRRTPCLAAAVDQAHNQTLTTGRQNVMRGATEMLFSAAGGAAGGGEIGAFLGKQLYDQVKDKLKDAALDRFKNQMREKMREGLPEYFQDDDNRGNCRTEFRIVWDKAAERYLFLMAGDCGCNQVSCGKQGGRAPLRRWALEGWGTVIPDIEQLANGDKRVTFRIGFPQDVSLTADCCGQGDRRFQTDPRTGPGNEWVGFVPPPPAQPPRTPTGGNRTPTQQPGQGTATDQSATPGQTGQTRRPPAPPVIDVPVIPDGPLTEDQLLDLIDRALAAQERAQAEREAADRRLNELRQSRAAQDKIAEAEAAYEAARDVHIRAMRARESAMERYRASQQQKDQTFGPPDKTSERLLAEHNKARVEVGVPPLMWDRRLAASAAAYGPVLAKFDRLVHAPRAGRESERENLLRLPRGRYKPEQMVGVWLSERRNFQLGQFPNVSKTGNWSDVAHYTQVIWRSTTRVGCAIHTEKRWDYLICRYSPPGNTDGRPVL